MHPSLFLCKLFDSVLPSLDVKWSQASCRAPLDSSFAALPFRFALLLSDLPI
jgi:hypothetical protein